VATSLDDLFAETSPPSAAPPASSGASMDDLFSESKTSGVGSFLRGAAQELTFGYADEIAGGIESLFTSKKYDQARDESRDAYKRAEADNPLAYTAGQVGGGIASLAVPVGGIARAASTGAKVARAAGAGALYGAGKSEAETLHGLAGDAATGAALGTAFYGAGRGVAAGAGRLAKLAKSDSPAVQAVKRVLTDKATTAVGGAIAGGIGGDGITGSIVGAGLGLLAPRIGKAAGKMFGKGVAPPAAAQSAAQKWESEAKALLGKPELAPAAPRPARPAVEFEPTMPGTPAPPTAAPAAAPAAPKPLTEVVTDRSFADRWEGESLPALPRHVPKPEPTVSPATKDLKLPAAPSDAKPAKVKMGEQLATPEQLAGVTSGGKPLEEAGLMRLDRMRNLKNLDLHAAKDPVRVTVSPGGKMEVSGGRHRILVARERGVPLKVKFERGPKSMDKGPSQAKFQEKVQAGYEQSFKAQKGRPEVVPDDERTVARMLRENVRARATIPPEDRSTLDALVNVVSSASKGEQGLKHYPVEPRKAFLQYLGELPKSTGGTAKAKNEALRKLILGMKSGEDPRLLIYAARAAGVPDNAILRGVGVFGGKAKAPRGGAPVSSPTARREPSHEEVRNER
jgi:hypothetical protein